MAGFTSVQQMIDTPGATWAHRGGSISYPEHSQYAYEQSAARGYGALEFSCARTSDGVWFGLHDANINHVAGVSGMPPASSMTWAQVQEYQVVRGQEGAPRPFWRLTDFLDTYAHTHVCIVDHKHAWDYLTEWLNILDSYNAHDRIVVKYFGDSTALANLAASRGYATWGYYYESDYASGMLAERQGPWTMLGMEYTASQAAWDAVLSYGKPVVGHIVPNLAAYNTAMAKGAAMAQVSGVAEVPAVGAPDDPTPPVSGGVLRMGALPVTGTFLGAVPVTIR